jgi:hypothetical protein
MHPENAIHRRKISKVDVRNRAGTAGYRAPEILLGYANQTAGTYRCSPYIPSNSI